MSILKFLGIRSDDAKAGADRSQTETVRKIVARLDAMPPEQARFIAAFAFMLSRVANADLDISAEEVIEMERLVVDEGGLAADQAVIVVQIAKSQNLLFGGTENYLVAKEFNQFASRDDKLRLLRCLFAVGAADDSISATEDNVIRQVAEELNLEHRDFIDVRAAFRDKLGVFQAKDSD